MALFFFLNFNVGCIPPIAPNTLGAASSSVPVAFHNKGGGKGESSWIAQYDDVIAAAKRTGEVLSLEVREEVIEEDQAFFSFHDGKAERIDILIERRTETMTSIQFDVGRSGSVAFGRLTSHGTTYHF